MQGSLPCLAREPDDSGDRECEVFHSVQGSWSERRKSPGKADLVSHPSLVFPWLLQSGELFLLSLGGLALSVNPANDWNESNPAHFESRP